jgi:NitT/TauT family transport system ATP-binding protein
MDISLENVSKVYSNGRKQLTALKPISLKIESGQFICLIGPSGCGKSTLLRILADQITPTTGSINLNDAPTWSVRRQKGFAWMAQNPALLPWKTVKENIQLTQIVNPSFTHAALSTDDYIQLVDLQGFEDFYPALLSGGMQQRTALARTLAIGASLWLMDEPFAALDEFTREDLSNKVINLWSLFNPTVVWVTHSIMEAVSLADRVLVMSQRPGQIKADVTINQSRPRDISEYHFLSVVKQLRALLKP